MKPLCKLNLFVAMLLSVWWQTLVVANPTDLNPPTILLQDIKIDSIAIDGARIFVDLEVYNPNTVSIVVESILYGLTLNQTPIKYGRIQQEEHFPARSERVVRVPVSLAYDEHLPDILAALTSTASSFYEIGGSVTIKGEKKPLLFHYKGQMISPLANNRMGKNQQIGTTTTVKGRGE